MLSLPDELRVLQRIICGWSFGNSSFSKGARILLPTALLLPAILSLILSGFVIHPAVAQTVGLVCLTPVSANACPAPPVTVSGSVGGQLMVPVLVQGSDILNGFDITLKTNHTVLVPAGVSVTGSLLTGGTTVLECLGTVLKAGPRCSPTDTPDTLHLVLAGPPGFFTFAPTTGLLFTAVYNITGTATTSIVYQTGCSPSSVSGTSTCVLVTNGSISPVAENVQTAIYTTSPTPTFTVTADFTLVGVRKGSSTTRQILVTSLNGFAGTVSLSVSITPIAKHSPTLSFTPSTVTMTAGGFATSVLTIATASNTTQGDYVLTVTGTSGTLSASVQMQLTVVP